MKVEQGEVKHSVSLLLGIYLCSTQWVLLVTSTAQACLELASRPCFITLEFREIALFFFFFWSLPWHVDVSRPETEPTPLQRPEPLQLDS